MANELMNIAEEIRQEINKSSTSWIRLGELLDKARNQPEMKNDDRAFGKWCAEQEFGVGRSALFQYRAAWKEWSAGDHDHLEKLTDFISWRRIASLNHVHKARVLERLAAADGKVVRRTVLEWIDQTRTQPKAVKEPTMDKKELKKAIKRAEAMEEAADKTQRYFESMIHELNELMGSDDYKIIRSVLHTDKEADPIRKNKAFTAFQKMDDIVKKYVSKTFSQAA